MFHHDLLSFQSNNYQSQREKVKVSEELVMYIDICHNGYSTSMMVNTSFTVKKKKKKKAGLGGSVDVRLTGDQEVAGSTPTGLATFRGDGS